ncbi:MAG: flavin reductase family protein [Clostridiales bacterium]|nr:flavin reductase family protein [Clostridiales bacterium]MDR2712128.1 flavin reductase family protein [Clostridiales bacterium]
MQKIPIPAYPMLNPNPIVIIGTQGGDKANYTTAGAFGVVCLEPIFYASLKDSHQSTANIRENGWFSVNIPGPDLLPQTDYCGKVSGQAEDKSLIFTPFYDEKGPAPLIGEAPLNYLCRVIDSHAIRGFTVFFGEIRSAYLNEDCFSEGRIDLQKIQPVLGMGATYFGLGAELGKVFQVKQRGEKC